MSFYFKLKLKKEIEIWEKNNLIDKNSSQKILDFYNLNEQESPFLKYFAYLCLALSLIVLIGANWGEIPKNLRLILLIGLTFFVQICGFLNKDKFFSVLLVFLGNFCFLGSMALISQMFNLKGDASDLILIYLIFTLPFVLILKHPILITQNLFIAVIWFFMEKYYGNLENLFLLILAINLFAIYKNYREDVFQIWLVCLTIFVFFIFDEGIEILNIFSIFLLFLFLISKVLKKNFLEFSDTLNNYSLKVGVCFLIFLLLVVNFSYEVNFGANFEINFEKTYLFCFLMAFISFLAIFTKSWLSLWFLVLLSFYNFAENFTYFQEIFSILMYFACIVFGIYLLNKIKNFALLLIFSTIVILYFDLIGDYILTSLIFLTFGIFMIFLSKRLKK